MKIEFIDLIYILLPSIIGFGTNILCKTSKESGINVKFRPPDTAFGIIWPILFLLFGVSWAISMRNCTNKTLCLSVYVLTILSLALWIFVYSCKKSKTFSCWVLIFTLAFAIMCLTQGSEVSKILAAPLISWTIFAMIMNTTEVQELN